MKTSHNLTTSNNFYYHFDEFPSFPYVFFYTCVHSLGHQEYSREQKQTPLELTTPFSCHTLSLFPITARLREEGPP